MFVVKSIDMANIIELQFGRTVTKTTQMLYH